MRARVLLAAAALTAAPARGESDRARCTGSLSGDRLLATVEVTGLFEKDMLRLIRLGMVGRVRIEAALVRKRRFWVESRLNAQPIEATVTYAKETRRFLLDGRRELNVEEPLSFGRLSLRFQDEIPAGAAFTLEMQVRLQVVTASSLKGVARWITGERQDDDSTVSRWVLTAVVNDLTRTALATCPVQGAGEPRP